MSLSAELVSRRIELAVMMQVMDADLESTLDKPGTKLGRHRVLTFGNEVERRAESKFHFEFGQLFYSIESSSAFDIMGQDECEFLAIWPTGPTLRRVLGALLDWPDGATTLQDSPNVESPQRHAQAGRQKWLKRDSIDDV